MQIYSVGIQVYSIGIQVYSIGSIFRWYMIRCINICLKRFDVTMTSKKNGKLYVYHNLRRTLFKSSKSSCWCPMRILGLLYIDNSNMTSLKRHTR